MFKLLPIILAVCASCVVLAEVQLLLPEALLSATSSKTSAQLAQERTITAADSGLNDIAGLAELPAESSSGVVTEAQEEAAATRTTIDALRATRVLTSANSLLPSIQHNILPAEAIPLPITISTRPGLRTVIAPETITIQQPTVAKIGEVVQKIPTAVSHQSQTVVHKHARVVTPIVAPAVRTVTSQLLRAYHTPLVLSPQTPLLQVVNN